jgi:hypothetical protein
MIAYHSEKRGIHGWQKFRIEAIQGVSRRYLMMIVDPNESRADSYAGYQAETLPASRRGAWMPHSIFARPRQRPARASSPG